MAVALAFSAAFLAVLAATMKPGRPQRRARERRAESTMGRANSKTTGKSRCEKMPLGAVRRGSDPQDRARAEEARAEANDKPSKPDDLNRKARNGCSRTRRRDRRGRFVSARSDWPFANLAKRADRRNFGEACRSMRRAIFAKRIGLNMPVPNGRDTDAAARRDGKRDPAGVDFDGLIVNNRRAARATCTAAAAMALAGAAAPLLAQAGSATLAGLTFGPPIVAMLAAALKSDHAAWQIDQKRFAGLTEYVWMRWLGQSRYLSRKGNGCARNASHGTRCRKDARDMASGRDAEVAVKCRG